MAKSKSSDLYVWLDGKMMRNSEAVVPILTHSMQYGSGMFEGLRAYKTRKGPAVFRLEDHVKRFFRTAKIYYMTLHYTPKQLGDAILSVVRKNKLDTCYIRPFAFYNDPNIGVSAYGKQTSIFVAAIPFGAYFGAAKEKGIRCKISSWERINSQILPPEAKVSGNYVNSIIANIEAINSGCDEAILTSSDGYVAEGSSENVFLVSEGKLVTPPRDADILLGVTRDSVIKMAESMGLVVTERNVHKEELYTADEVFFTGTAAEITPVTYVDSRKVGNGKPGPITKMLGDKYTQIVGGNDTEFSSWLTYV